MATFCLPKNKVEELKKSALKGEINIRELYSMTSKERRDFFTKHTDKDLGKFLNVEFEKAMISKQKTALTDWAKSVFKPEAQSKPVYKNVIDKIKSLDDMGVLSPAGEQAFLEDLVSDKLGITVSPEEVLAIHERAQAIEKAQEALGVDLGNPDKLQENLDFFKAKKVMDDYLLSLTPASKLKVLTSTIGRGMMLASIKAPVLNIGSNIEVGFTEALTRRIAGNKLKGSDNQQAIAYMKMVNKIYQATGYDLSRMMSLSDTGASGARVLGNDMVHSQGKGKIRKVGRIIEDVVFKQLMGAPDVAFSAGHFADSVNINSLKLAKGDTSKGAKYMSDAMRLEPQTAEGETLRAQGILDAQKATWTDTSWVSKVSEGIRKILNQVSGDLRAGDYLLPFIKTPANVIATGMDYAGLGIPRSTIRMIKQIRAGDLSNKEEWQKTAKDLVRAGLGITGAAILTAAIGSDNFIGAYDPQRFQIEQLRNSNTNSIKIGNKWISVDWLGPLAVPVTAMMYAKKYGTTGGEKTFQYAKGVGGSFFNAPGIKDTFDYAKSKLQGQNQTLDEATSSTGDFITSEIYSRLVPSFLGDIAKATDPSERKTKKGVDTIKSKIPGLRQTLPVKRDVFGDEMKGESAVSDLLFGARVKTDRDNPTISEIRDVSNNTDKAINFTDWDRSTNKTLVQYKQKVGQEKYDETKIVYGQELKKGLEKLFDKPSYDKLSDNEKLKAINDIDAEAMKKVLSKEGFTYKKFNSTAKNKPTFESSPTSEKTFIQKIATYAEAIGTDPVTAFQDIIQGQSIRRIDNGTIVVNRMSLADSSKVKSEGGGNNPTMKLDHTVPLQLGGTNVASNLKLVPTDDWASYTPVENYLGKALRAGKADKKDVQRLITAFKNKEMTFDEIKKELDK